MQLVTFYVAGGKCAGRKMQFDLFFDDGTAIEGLRWKFCASFKRNLCNYLPPQSQTALRKSAFKKIYSTQLHSAATTIRKFFFSNTIDDAINLILKVALSFSALHAI